MILPKEAELLGANSEELEIKGSGADTVVRLNTDLQKLVTGLAKTSSEKPPGGIYLALENVRGTQDATVLDVSISRREDASLGEQRDQLAGSVGLYGLRRASVQSDQGGGSGLSFVLDITQILLEQPVAALSDANEIHVSIVPHHRLPDAAPIAVGRVSIFFQRHVA
jgi:tyrosinase